MELVERYELAADEIRTYCVEPPYWLMPERMIDCVNRDRVTSHAATGTGTVRPIREGLKRYAKLDCELYNKDHPRCPERALAMPMWALLNILHRRPPYQYCDRLDIAEFFNRLIEYYIAERKLRFWIASLPGNSFWRFDSFTSYDGMMVIPTPAGLFAWPYHVVRQPGQFLPSRLELVARLLGGLREAPDVPSLPQGTGDTSVGGDIFSDYNAEYVQQCLSECLRIARGADPNDLRAETMAGVKSAKAPVDVNVPCPLNAREKAAQNIQKFLRELETK